MEAIDHARQVLPAWVGWLGPGGYLVATSVLGWLCLRLTGMQLLQPLKRARQRALVERRRVHWSETARLGFAARRGYLMMSVLLMVIFGAAAAFWCGPLARLSWGAVAALVVLSQLLLAVVGYRKQVMTVVMEVLPPWRDSLAGVAIQALLLRPAMFVVLAAMWLAPERLLSWQAALWLSLLVSVLVGVQLGCGLKLLLWLGLAQPADAHLRMLVAKAAVGGPTPKAVYVLRWPMSNAVALPLPQALAFSDRALEVHPDDELMAIAAHELGHLAESAASRRMRLAMPLLLIPLALLQTIVNEVGVVAAAAVLVVVMVLLVVVRRRKLKLEHRADAHAHEHGDPQVYARALERLYQVNRIPAVMRTERTHPHLYDRLLATGVTPDFERPAPPPSYIWSWVWPVATAIALMVAVGSYWVQSFRPQDNVELPANWSLALAFDDDGSAALAKLAGLRMPTDPAAADVLFDAALEAARDDRGQLREILMQRIFSLAENGRCDEARRYRDQWRQQPQWHLSGSDATAANLEVRWLLPTCDGAVPAGPQ